MSKSGDQELKKYDAPPGTVYVCNACGKTASNKANGGISHGWDAACFMNSVLCYTKKRDGKWILAPESPP